MFAVCEEQFKLLLFALNNTNLPNDTKNVRQEGVCYSLEISSYNFMFDYCLLWQVK